MKRKDLPMYTQYYNVLHKVPHIADVSTLEAENLLQALNPVVKNLKKDDYLVREGDPIEFSGIVAKGKLMQIRYSLAGEKAVFELLGEGRTFGETIIMLPSRKTWASDFVARTDSTVLLFDKTKMRDSMSDPNIFTNSIWTNYLYNVACFTENAMVALRSLRNTTVRQKISTYLYEMYLHDNQTHLVLPFDRSELAGYLFMPQSSLSREMSKMREEGIIDYHKSTIKILDLDALKR